MNENTTDKSASEKLADLFAAQKLTATITGAHAHVKPGEGHEGKGWACVSMVVTIHARRTAMENRIVSESFDWSMGTGLVDWKALAKRVTMGAGAHSKEYVLINSMGKYGVRLTPEDQARACNMFLPAFVARVNASEVLARSCSEGLEASENTFEDWAANFGMDSDSRKAEKIYFTCQDNLRKVRALLGSAAVIKQFAELANEL